MHRVTDLFAACLLAAIAPAAAHAQAIPVVVVVSLPSQPATAAPISGLELSITPLSGGASVLATTDSSGQAAVRLLPGRYRIRSLTTARRDGAEYSWDVEATIRTLDKSVAITLNRQNAAAVAGTTQLPPGTTVIQAQPTQPGQPLTTGHIGPLGPGEPGYKDPAMAVLFGLLLTGGGHMYSGETTTGVLYLLGTVALAGIAIGSCTYDSCDESLTTGALVGALSLAIYSVVDGAAAASRSNKKGLRTVSLGPMQFKPTTLGLALSIPLP